MIKSKNKQENIKQKRTGNTHASTDAEAQPKKRYVHDVKPKICLKYDSMSFAQMSERWKISTRKGYATNE
jgi:hypothetical protein